MKEGPPLYTSEHSAGHWTRPNYYSWYHFACSISYYL